MSSTPPAPWLARVTGAHEVTSVVALSGGASRETYSFDADGSGMIVQRQRPGSPRSLVQEAKLVRLACSHGVPVAEQVAAGVDDTGLEYLVTVDVPGETIPRRILRDDRFANARKALTGQLGAALGALGAVPTAEVPSLDTSDQLDLFRRHADELDIANVVFELAFAWLGDNRPPPSGAPGVVHGDFRMGNLIVDEHGLAAVLDWELAHIGDPLEDLGWLCAPAWRFGSELAVAGVGDDVELIAVYEKASGRSIDREAFRWWRTLATLKWGIMCVQQARTHLDGVVRSHELAAIGRRVCQTEDDLLNELMVHPS